MDFESERPGFLSSAPPLMGSTSLKTLFNLPVSRFLICDLRGVGAALECLFPIPHPGSYRPRAW